MHKCKTQSTNYSILKRAFQYLQNTYSWTELSVPSNQSKYLINKLTDFKPSYRIKTAKHLNMNRALSFFKSI